MDYPTVHSYTSVATDTVSRVINAALEKVGSHLTLCAMAETRAGLQYTPSLTDKVVDSQNINKSSEEIIRHTIDNIWKLNRNFKYVLRFLEYRSDECTQYYHYEALFSQPTPKYPIPQVTASVFFTVKTSLIHGSRKAPKVSFRVEGHHQGYDLRYMKLPDDWLFALMKTKSKLYKTIEDMNTF